VAGRGDFEVEMVGAVGGECDCEVVMTVVEVVDWGFACAMDLCALAGGGSRGFITSL
jgi:hypothetical protein